MPGKYAHIIDKLPRFLGTEPAHQAKIDAVKEAMKQDPDFKLHASALAQQYAILRGLRDPLKDELSKLQVQIEAVEQMLDEQYEVEGTSSISLATGGTVRVQHEPYAKVEDRELFRLWCLKNDLEREMCLPWMKTNSLLKELLLDGQPEPPGVVAKAITKVVLTKG